MTPMSTCPPEEHLSAFLDGELPEAQATAIDAHCRACPACGDALAVLRQVEGLAALLKAEPVADSEWAATWASLAGRIGAAPRASRRAGLWAAVVRARRVWVPAAAAAVLALAVGLATYRPNPARPQAHAPAAEPEPVGADCIVESVEPAEGYTSMFQVADVTIITLLPDPMEEAPSSDESPSPL
jgi:anti-sigma factor RsiW